MSDERFYQRIHETLEEMETQGLRKPERVLTGRQGARVTLRGPQGMAAAANFCANDYLGLAGDPRVAAAAAAALEQAGAGFASVRFICGTHELHKELEAAIAAYLGYEDAILFPAAFDANGGVFEPLLDERDAIVSDRLNHASIIDGVRLCKASRYRYRTHDHDDLEAQLKAARAGGSRHVLIATDGVFSMDGYLVDLPALAELADRYDALILMDDCHATGVVGPRGRGVGAHFGLADRVDIVTGTFGKALGGAMGGFVAARRPVIELLRQRARPYLFSNALAPAVCGAALEAIRLSDSAEGDARRERLATSAAHFRAAMTNAGFDLIPGAHPITPVRLGEASLAMEMAADLVAQGILVAGFAYPVVPHGEARIRVQVSANHTVEDLDHAVSAFVSARARCGAAA